MVSAIVTLLARLPEVPVMVTVEEPGTALPDAENVTVLLLAVLVGEKVAVTPVGRPEAVSATVPPKPLRSVMAMVLAPLVPGFRLTLAGVADSVKLSGAPMVSAIVALLLKLPDVPVMVTVELPVAAELLALRVSVLVPDVPAPKDAVTPEGRPDAARATVPLKPFCGVAVIVLAPVPPSATVTLEGDAESV
jgi:hypothetical protein